MPRRVDVSISDEEREVLERWARRPKSAQALALRCRIVLAAAEGRPSNEIAGSLGCTTQTVGRWRGRFAARGLHGLHDEPRPGRPRRITDPDVERVIVKTLAGGRHPLVDPLDGRGDRAEPDRGQPDLAGLRTQAASLGALQALADPQFIDKVRDVVGLGSTSTRPKPRSCSASTRSPGSRHSSVARRSCR
jgi:DNA-binding CsgD family transcriptional regulator